MGVLVIRRTLAHGQLAGFVTGLGIASADATYGTIAALGLTFLINTLISLQPVVQLLGGLFLIYLGIRSFRAQPATEAARAGGSSRIGLYGSALLFTLTNPSTILMFLGIFAGAGMAASGGCSGFIVAGVFAGSTLWWLILSTGVSLLRTRFTPGVLVWVNRVSGMIIGAYGVVAIFSLLIAR